MSVFVHSFVYVCVNNVCACARIRILCVCIYTYVSALFRMFYCDSIGMLTHVTCKAIYSTKIFYQNTVKVSS